VSLGATLVVPPTPIPGMGGFALFTDPDGNVMGIFREDASAT
jgi:predicted enzyme related to lactoylglutathione lyase